MKKNVLVAVAMALGVSAFAAEIKMKGFVGEVDWRDGDNFVGGVAPVAGDTVVLHDEWISSTGWASVSNSTDDASFALIASLERIVIPAGVTFNLTVPDGVVAELPVSIVAEEEGSGKFVKLGGGELKLTSATPTVSGSSVTYDDLEVNLTIEDGKLTLPVRELAEGGQLLMHNFISVRIESGATLQTVQNGNMTIKSLNGGGTLRNDGEKAVQLIVNGSPPGYESVFSGKITGSLSIDARASRMTLTGVDSDFTGGVAMRHNGYPEARKLILPMLGMHGEPSPAGVSGQISFGSGGGSLLYTGSGETSDKNLTMSQPRNVIDGGADGGLKLTGTLHAYSSTKTLNKVYLTGSNTVPCEIAGIVRTWNVDEVNRPFHFTKQGSGTWIFNQPEPSNIGGVDISRGVIAVEEGTVEFGSIAESNEFCALGLSTDLYRREADTPSDADRVEYAYLLGGTDASGMPTEGRMRYTGSEPARCTTRPIALKTDGALAVTASEKLRFFDVRAEGAGPKTLALEAAEGASGDLFDVVDSADSPISVVKRGSGTWRIGGTQALHGGISVEGGVLVLENTPADAPYSWFRFSVKEVVAGCARYSSYSGESFTDYNFNGDVAALNVSELGLFDEDGNRIGVGISDVGHEFLIGPGDCAYEHPERIKSTHYDSAGYCLFDSLKQTAEGFYCGGLRLTLNEMPRKDDRATWFPIVFRVTNGTPAAVAWDFVNTRALYGALDGNLGEVQRQVTAARMEGSRDGVHWEVLSDVDVEIPEAEGLKYVWCSANDEWRMNLDVKRRLSDGKGFRLSRTVPSRPSAPWAELSHLSVKAGSELHVEGERLMVTKLHVDVVNGFGAVRNVRFAESGEIDFSGLPEDNESHDVSWVMNDVEGLSNLSGWTLTSGGVPLTDKRVRVGLDGLRIRTAKGTCLVIR